MEAHEVIEERLLAFHFKRFMFVYLCAQEGAYVNVCGCIYVGAEA